MANFIKLFSAATYLSLRLENPLAVGEDLLNTDFYMGYK